MKNKIPVATLIGLCLALKEILPKNNFIIFLTIVISLSCLEFFIDSKIKHILWLYSITKGLICTIAIVSFFIYVEAGNMHVPLDSTGAIIFITLAGGGTFIYFKLRPLMNTYYDYKIDK